MSSSANARPAPGGSDGGGRGGPIPHPHDGRLTPELARLRDSFNRMAARLTEADETNRRLNEQLLTLQDQERSELAGTCTTMSARFYSPSMSMPRRLAAAGRGVAAEAVGHISRLPRQSAICSGRSGRCSAGCGRSGSPNRPARSIENLVGFGGGGAGSPLSGGDLRRLRGSGELVGTTICRVIQEA